MERERDFTLQHLKKHSLPEAVSSILPEVKLGVVGNWPGGGDRQKEEVWDVASSSQGIPILTGGGEREVTCTSGRFVPSVTASPKQPGGVAWGSSAPSEGRREGDCRTTMKGEKHHGTK